MSTSTICAVSTASGGAIGVVRVSGSQAISITEHIFRAVNGKPLSERKESSLTFGYIVDENDKVVDEVLVSLFRAPHSYTGEDATEISCHGSSYILQRVVQLLLAAGCEAAAPGEFTQRAFLNGKMDLSQAEAVADVIASTTAASHQVAMSQMRGDFSKQLGALREQLVHLTSLLELELDFSDHEDLEFADRSALDAIAAQIESVTQRLADSFATGNVLKNGLPVAIVGSTNSGKSTLLNALLHDDRAIVSDVHGTTRDVIEDTFTLGGTLFRFIDTAGLRSTEDVVEQMGIARSRQKLEEAKIVLFVVDATQVASQMEALGTEILEAMNGRPLVVLFNKADLLEEKAMNDLLTQPLAHWISGVSLSSQQEPKIVKLSISAKEGLGLDTLTDTLVGLAQENTTSAGDIIVTNARHYAALTAALADIRRVRQGLSTHLSGDFVAQDLRECLFHLAEITGGAVTTDEVLGTIFKNFCVGK
jgi:tRNA modification GTPase trmE